jgi:hypothetical protein
VKLLDHLSHLESSFFRRAVDVFTKLGSPDLANAGATLRECSVKG